MVEVWRQVQISPGMRNSAAVWESSGFWRSGNNVRFRNGAVQAIESKILVSSNEAVHRLPSIVTDMHTWAVSDGGNRFAVAGPGFGVYVHSGPRYLDITPDGITPMSDFRLPDRLYTYYGGGDYNQGFYGGSSSFGDIFNRDALSYSNGIGFQLTNRGSDLLIASRSDRTIFRRSFSEIELLESQVAGSEVVVPFFHDLVSGSFRVRFRVWRGFGPVNDLVSSGAAVLTSLRAQPFPAGFTGPFLFNFLDLWSRSDLDNNLLPGDYTVTHIYEPVSGGPVSADLETFRFTVYRPDRVVKATPLDNAPRGVGVLVSDQQHVLILQASDSNDDGSPDRSHTGFPNRVWWSDRNDSTVWTSTRENSAGFVDLDTVGSVVSAVNVPSGVLLFTTIDTHLLRWVGGLDEFSVRRVATSSGIIGPSAVAVAGDQAYWMGEGDFYVYDGSVRVLPCSVHGYVFNSLDLERGYIVSAGVNSLYSEVWWHYSSTDAAANDRYVVYNYSSGVWYTGFGRSSSWLGGGVRGRYITAEYFSDPNHTILKTFLPGAGGTYSSTSDFDRFGRLFSGADDFQVFRNELTSSNPDLVWALSGSFIVEGSGELMTLLQAEFDSGVSGDGSPIDLRFVFRDSASGRLVVYPDFSSPALNTSRGDGFMDLMGVGREIQILILLRRDGVPWTFNGLRVKLDVSQERVNAVPSPTS